MPRIKPPFLKKKTAIHFTTHLIEIVSSYYIQASRNFNSSYFKDYKTLKENNRIFSYPSPTQILPEKQRGQQDIFPDSSINCKIEIKKNEDVTGEVEKNIQTQFQLQKKGKLTKVIIENHNKEFWIKLCMGKLILEGQ